MSVYHIIIVSPSGTEGVPKGCFLIGLAPFVNSPHHKNNPQIQRLYSSLQVKTDAWNTLEAIKEDFPHISMTLGALLTACGASKDVALSPGTPREILAVLCELDFKIVTSSSSIDPNGKGGIVWTLEKRKFRFPSPGFT